MLRTIMMTITILTTCLGAVMLVFTVVTTVVVVIRYWLDDE